LHEGAGFTGEGPHGPIVEGYQGRWHEAVDWLRKAETGDMRGVLEHPEVAGRIDVVWGDKEYGLAHILGKHPAIVDDFPTRLAGMHKIFESKNRIRLWDGTAMAVISREWHGTSKTWLLTAFEPTP